MRKLITVIGLLLALTACDPIKNVPPTISGPPEGATIYIIHGRTYEMTGPGRFAPTSRRLHVEINAVDASGGDHGTWWKENTEGPKSFWEIGQYPYRNTEQSGWNHPIYIGGTVPIITAEAIITVEDVNIGDKLECWISKNGLEVRDSRNEIIASERGSLLVRCLI